MWVWRAGGRDRNGHAEAVGDVFLGESRDTCHLHTLKRHLDFPVPGSILGGGDGVIFMVLTGDAPLHCGCRGPPAGLCLRKGPSRPCPASLLLSEGLLLWRQRHPFKFWLFVTGP